MHLIWRYRGEEVFDVDTDKISRAQVQLRVVKDALSVNATEEMFGKDEAA